MASRNFMLLIIRVTYPTNKPATFLGGSIDIWSLVYRYDFFFFFFNYMYAGRGGISCCEQQAVVCIRRTASSRQHLHQGNNTVCSRFGKWREAKLSGTSGKKLEKKITYINHTTKLQKKEKKKEKTKKNNRRCPRRFQCFQFTCLQPDLN